MSNLAAAVRAKIPSAQIDFVPDPQIQSLLDEMVRPLDDSRAREEWGWEATYDLNRMIGEFVDKL